MWKENSPISTNIAFQTLFLSYLTEAQEKTLAPDCALVDFKKMEEYETGWMRVHEYFHSLTLPQKQVSGKPQPEKIKKTEIDKLSRKSFKVYKTCKHVPLTQEESSDGYQAYEFVQSA